MKFCAVILCNVTKEMVETNFQNCCYRDDDVTNHINLFEKSCEKLLKYVFFSKINLVTARKKNFQDLFSVFESQDNIQIEYIYFNMIMFLKKSDKKELN